MNTKHLTIISLSLLALTGVLGITDAQEEQVKNPSLLVELITIPWQNFNKISTEAQIIELSSIHKTSWQVTIDNNLQYGNPSGNAVIRLYDENVEDKFVEIGMGAPDDDKLWVAVQIPGAEEYVVVHSKLERGWVPSAKTIISYTERAGMTINNGARIIITNLDIGVFGIKSYSVHGMVISSTSRDGFFTCSSCASVMPSTPVRASSDNEIIVRCFVFNIVLLFPDKFVVYSFGH